MSAINWKEITGRAYEFVKKYGNMSSERKEAVIFWTRLLEVYGVDAAEIASFEEPVKNLKEYYDRIDMYWPGHVIVEYKSKGESLEKAQSQAYRYIQQLIDDPAKPKLPRFIILSDFANFVLIDHGNPARDIPSAEHRFSLEDFPTQVHLFDFFLGIDHTRPLEQEELNLKAVELLGSLHDVIEEAKYPRKHLDTYMMRLLFCLFADDTGILDRQMERILQSCNPDGAETGQVMQNMFDVLNTPEGSRQSTLPEQYTAFPYVNGGLFEELLPLLYYSREMHQKLLECARFDWGLISPVVFGALFQAIMDPKERRQYGAHYTSERDIMKVIRPLFLDDLQAEFKAIGHSKAKLEQFHRKLASLRFLDPACGCGNFLMIAYREIRRLETEVIRMLHPKKEKNRELFDVAEKECLVNVDQFYGIEIEEWPARIAEVAMWLMDHVMNREFSDIFGGYFTRLPLTAKANIHHGNALRMDWNELLPATECSYVLGNPPFIGAKYQSDPQKEEMKNVTGGIKNSGLLDYVTAWYFKAADYSKGTTIRTAFVSTNSISQGEQVGVLWNALFARGMRIQFGYRTFAWESEARGKAHVHVVIIGFAEVDSGRKLLFDEAGGQPDGVEVSNISPYLIEGEDFTIINRSKPLCDVPGIGIGNKPIDGGHYLFLPDEKEAFLELEPGAASYFRRWMGADEFINGKERWCLWLGDCAPDVLKKLPYALKRVEAVRQFRLASKSKPTQKIASTPTRFHVENMPDKEFMLVPKVSSERRNYIPIGFMSPNTFVSDLCFIVRDSTLYHFGILTSEMHMAWMRQVGGRLESRYRYSARLVYNNYPWPQDPDAETVQKLEKAAQSVLDARAKYPTATMADLYDPNSMPPDLARAHAALDRAVDRAYRKEPFTSERERVEFLFGLYQQLVAAEKTKK